MKTAKKIEVQKPTVTAARLHIILGTRRPKMKPQREYLLGEIEKDLTAGKVALEDLVSLHEGKTDTFVFRGRSYGPKEVFGVKWQPEKISVTKMPAGLCLAPKGADDCVVLVRGDKNTLDHIEQSLTQKKKKVVV